MELDAQVIAMVSQFMNSAHVTHFYSTQKVTEILEAYYTTQPLPDVATNITEEVVGLYTNLMNQKK